MKTSKYTKKTFLSVHEHEKVRLGDAIPLKTPLSVLFSVADYCNLKCNFCLFGRNSKADDISRFNKFREMMSLDTFIHVVNQMKNFDEQIKVVKFLGTGESLVNKDFVKMVEYLKKSNVTQRIHLVTNGILLTEELSLALVAAGVDEIQISINGLDEKQYLEVTETNMDFGRFIENISFLYHNRGNCKLFIKVMNVAVEGREDEFEKIFAPISDMTYIETAYPLFENVEVEGNKHTTDLLGQTIVKTAKVCPMVFYQVIVNANGDITGCVRDFNRKITLGNINENEFNAIWNGQKANDIRKLSLEGKIETIEVCQNCLLKTICISLEPANDIDDDAERLLKIYTQN